MCTLSWLAGEDAYTLWFNRDERHTRAAELPPVECRAGEARWLAPSDPDSGGTWLMVNTHGVTAALLNDYASPWREPTSGNRESRGRLVPLAAGASTARVALEQVQAEVLERTPPFEFFAIDPTGATMRLHWDGAVRRVTQGNRVTPPLTSSSHRPEAVCAWRRQAFPRRGDEAALQAYHHSHDTTAGAWSVNMSRGDASTRSISRVRVGPEWVMLDYETQCWPGAPRVGARPLHLRLPRAVVQPV